MPIRRHGKGWEVRVQTAYRRTSKTLPTRRDAQTLEANLRQQDLDHLLGRAPRYALEDAIARWLKGEASVLKSLEDLKDKIRTLAPFLAGKALTQVVDVAEAVKVDGLAAGNAPGTINRKLAILRRVANLAYRQWNWLDRPLGDRVRLLAGERARHLYLTPDQVRRLAAKAPSAAVRDAILLASMSGLRRGELLRLQPQDRRAGALHVAQGKTGLPRVVPLPPAALKIALPLAVDKTTLRKGYDVARTRSGLHAARFHDLRHTYASWLVQSGASLTVVRDLLGHSSLAVTSRYAHLGTEHLQAAVDQMAAGLERGRQNKKKAA